LRSITAENQLGVPGIAETSSAGAADPQEATAQIRRGAPLPPPDVKTGIDVVTGIAAMP
jgi:hypothetical protein